MISAWSPAASWMTSLIWVTSPMVMSLLVMLISTPVAPAIEMLSSSGLLIACWAASSARFSPLADAGAHQRGAAVLHHGADVGEVHVDQAGAGDQVGDALGGVEQHLIGLLAGRPRT